MGREENVFIFNDTEKMCTTNKRIKEALESSRNRQEYILENQTVSISVKKREHPANVTVTKNRTFAATTSYNGKGRIAVHNFASATNPGGGVTKGSSAQEECLCRCSDLYFCLNTKGAWDSFYGPHRSNGDSLHNDDIIYTPDVLVFKTDTQSPVLMPDNEWYSVDVITCAAPNLRQKQNNSYNSERNAKSIRISDRDLLELHERRLRKILSVAVSKGVDTIILGAFGCGAFENKPDIVALAAKNVIKDFLYDFDNIEFAVYCSPKDDTNFKVFSRILSSYQAKGKK